MWKRKTTNKREAKQSLILIIHKDGNYSIANLNPSFGFIASIPVDNVKEMIVFKDMEPSVIKHIFKDKYERAENHSPMG